MTRRHMSGLWAIYGGGHVRALIRRSQSTIGGGFGGAPG